MLQDNPLLAQLKQQLHSQTPRAEGVVKSTEKSYGFLEVDGNKSYFIPPAQMKKVMHGDRIVALLHFDKDRETAEPETLIGPFLTRFVGRVHIKGDKLSITPDHPMLRDAISCRAAHSIEHTFQEGDWAVAEMRRHPLKGDRAFYAELTQFITEGDDLFAPWWVTLARHNLEKEAPNGEITARQDSDLVREDLTNLPFITIDSASTKDMDDALYAQRQEDGCIALTVAIADPTAWIVEGSELDKLAEMRAFTNYLPGFVIPMLPRELSDDLCSLRPNAARPVLACRMIVGTDGAIAANPHFFTATICSHSKLAYNDVSDWLEQTGSWQPPDEVIADQLQLLNQLCIARSQWRYENALVFKDRPDYRFILGEKGEVLDIIAEPRRIANRIVEEAMIAANICAALVLREKLGFGIYNVHAGFDPASIGQMATLLNSYGMQVNAAEVLTLPGFCKLRRKLDAMPTDFLNSRIRRFQSFAEVSIQPGAHFGLGLEAYATWTSPIRKYGDMINHRLLKAIIKGESAQRPQDKTLIKMAERRRLNRLAERDVGDWLYAQFLKNKAGEEIRFDAEIIDISRGGMRVRLVDNGAIAFIPASFIHSVRDDLICSQENGTVQLKGETVYRITDVISVTVAEVRLDSRSVIARPA